jgi:hypothetical protein
MMGRVRQFAVTGLDEAFFRSGRSVAYNQPLLA